MWALSSGLDTCPDEPPQDQPAAVGTPQALTEVRHAGGWQGVVGGEVVLGLDGVMRGRRLQGAGLEVGKAWDA
jgi:hypothetical protein